MSKPQIVEILEGSFNALADETYRRVWGTPGYDEQHMDPADLRATLEANLRAIVACLPAQAPLPEDAVTAAHRIGRSRALQGVGIDAVMSSWSTAERVLVDALLGHADLLPAAQLRAWVARLSAIIERLTRESVEEYRLTQHEVTAHYDRVSADLVAMLLGERPAETGEIRRSARTAGVDPDVPYLAMVVSATAAAAPADTRAQRHVLAALSHQMAGRVILGVTDGYPLLLIPTTEDPAGLICALEEALRPARAPVPMLVAVAEAAVELPLAGESCRAARDAVEVGRRLGWQERVVRAQDVAAETLLIRNPPVADALLRRIAALLDRPELLETLRVYLSCGLSARETARILYVHANTVPYRLRVIERLLGCSLSDVRQLSDAILALRWLDLIDSPHVAATFPSGSGKSSQS